MNLLSYQRDKVEFEVLFTQLDFDVDESGLRKRLGVHLKSLGHVSTTSTRSHP